MSAYVSLNERIGLSSPLTNDSLVILHSQELNPTPEPQAHIDNTNVNFYNEEGNNILHISFRRVEKQIVFNTAPDGVSWEREERVGLSDVLLRNDTFIVVYDHGDRYQILVDGRTVHHFNKRYGGEGVEVSYEVNKYTQNPIFSHTLDVQATEALA